MSLTDALFGRVDSRYRLTSSPEVHIVLYMLGEPVRNSHSDLTVFGSVAQKEHRPSPSRDEIVAPTNPYRLALENAAPELARAPN